MVESDDRFFPRMIDRVSRAASGSSQDREACLIRPPPTHSLTPFFLSLSPYSIAYPLVSVSLCGLSCRLSLSLYLSSLQRRAVPVDRPRPGRSRVPCGWKTTARMLRLCTSTGSMTWLGCTTWFWLNPRRPLLTSARYMTSSSSGVEERRQSQSSSCGPETESWGAAAGAAPTGFCHSQFCI